MTSGNRQHGSACCSLSGTSRQNPPAFSTAPVTQLCSPAPPHLTSPLPPAPFSITLSTFNFAHAYKCSWFPSLPICFSRYLSPQVFPRWCTTWSLEPSAFLWYHTITLKEIGSGLCGQTPNSNSLLRAFSLCLHSMIFTPSISSVIPLVFF